MKLRILFPLVISLVGTVSQAAVVEADVCIFGATSGGIAAAIQASRMGKSAVIVEPGRFIGGLTTGGLGATDIGNKAAIGGISREFYGRIADHYSQSNAWKFETAQQYFTQRSSGQAKSSEALNAPPGQRVMWTFEPSVAEATYEEMLREAKVTVHREQPLASVRKEGSTLRELQTARGDTFRARMFIDATYEGDLLAAAGVRYHVGREANATYNETLNGVRERTPKHQFIVPVDPYKIPGKPESGLLPYIQGTGLSAEGSGDAKVQTYNYRLCFTTNAANRLPIAPPKNYDPARYELLGRYMEALVTNGLKPILSEFWNPIWMPNQKTDINNNGGFSTDYIGANWNYPEADYAMREKIRQDHEDYTRGFLTYLATSPRVPRNIRDEMQQWGPAKDEFKRTGGWPNQLYVREGRRMVSDYVMTEHNCRGKVVAQDPVGLGAYNMDSHNVQRVARNGRVENEGDVQTGVKPYPISYRSIIPAAGEASNLLVPVALAASHIAYGSIRMEPVFMILGQSAATAAVLAMTQNVSVQKLPYAALQERLLKDKQVLTWTNPVVVTGRDLPGIVFDDTAAEAEGDWMTSSVTGVHRIGSAYVHDGNDHKGKASLTYHLRLKAPRTYEVRVASPANSNRATNVPVTVVLADGTQQTFRINQQKPGQDGFHSLGKMRLGAGSTVRISNEGTHGHVVADGLQLLPAETEVR